MLAEVDVAGTPTCSGPEWFSAVWPVPPPGVKAGVPPERLLEAVRGGAYGKHMSLSQGLPQVVFKGDFDNPRFALALARKRSFGPFGREAPDREKREKQLAAITMSCDFTSEQVEVVDITDDIVKLFDPPEKALKHVREIRKVKPIKLTVLADLPADH